MITYQQHSEKCTFLFSTFWAFLYWHLQLTRFSNTMRYNRQLWKALHLYLLTRFSNRLVGAVAVRCALQNTWILIYIPLCIYFNHGWCRGCGVAERFTFHYVSISTVPGSNNATTDIVFTFHYVSISTCWPFCCIHVYNNLHSTMYLFQRWIRQNRHPM